MGSTDFLGNPSGFLADVSEGVSELVHEGSVGGLVWNVTHGMANSTAKVTGKLLTLLPPPPPPPVTQYQQCRDSRS